MSLWPCLLRIHGAFHSLPVDRHIHRPSRLHVKCNNLFVHACLRYILSSRLVYMLMDMYWYIYLGVTYQHHTALFFHICVQHLQPSTDMSRLTAQPGSCMSVSTD